MSAFTGKQHRGAKAELRKIKREEAEARNLITKPENRRAAHKAK